MLTGENIYFSRFISLIFSALYLCKIVTRLLHFLLQPHFPPFLQQPGIARAGRCHKKKLHILRKKDTKIFGDFKILS